MYASLQSVKIIVVMLIVLLKLDMIFVVECKVCVYITQNSHFIKSLTKTFIEIVRDTDLSFFRFTLVKEGTISFIIKSILTIRTDYYIKFYELCCLP